jgi:hypothetical protein
MDQSKVILFILPFVGDRDNVINFKILALKLKVDGVLANETNSVLPRVEAVFKLPTLLRLQLGKKKRMDGHTPS